MLIAPHPALNQLIGVMLGMALAVGDMANAWQEQHLPILHVAASAIPSMTPMSWLSAGCGAMSMAGGFRR